MDKDLEIEIDDVADLVGKEPDAPVVTKKEEPKQEEAKPDRALANLTRERDAVAAERDEERTRREAAEKAAQEATDAAAKWGVHASNAEYQSINVALARSETEIAAAKRDYKLAFESGDGEKAAEAQERIALAAADLRDLRAGKADMEARFEQARQKKPEPTVTKTETAKPEGDPVENYLKQFPRLSQDWLREHPEYVTDGKLNKKMVAYAGLAEAEGIKPHSAEFISFLEEKLGLAEREEEEDGEEEEVEVAETRSAPVRTKARPMAAAPVSRDPKTFSSDNLGGKKVRLSPKLASIAKELGFDPETYAKGSVRAIREGKISKSFLDRDHDHGI